MILKSLADDVEFADLERMFLCFVTRHSCHSFFSTFALKQIVFGSEIKLQSNTKTRTLCISFDSYIKPQLETSLWDSSVSCISFDSYIKPQLFMVLLLLYIVVYLLIPTSNHNPLLSFDCGRTVVYLLIPTSNHNIRTPPLPGFAVVYLLIPTSNHNVRWMRWMVSQLYIFWFLHQTTTCTLFPNKNWRCISFDSYIKPQPVTLLATNI